MPTSRPAVVARLRDAGCVYADDEANLLIAAARTATELDDMVERRAGGLPLEQVLGWARFRGLRIAVGPGVFVPRRRSEFLVERAVTALGPGAVVVDLCCGSGAVGAAVAHGRDVVLHAVDVDPVALSCARHNLPGAAVHLGDLYEPLPAALRGRVDVIVAVTPYVPSAEIRLLPREARSHEPRASLDGGHDGLDVLRRVSAGAADWLRPGGRLLAETSEQQAPTAAAALTADGLVASVERDADRGATVVVGTRPRQSRTTSPISDQPAPGSSW